TDIQLVFNDFKTLLSGGQNKSQQFLNDFFYLDVFQNFAITALPWNDLSFTGASKTAKASACSRNNNDLFIFGGIIQNNLFAWANTTTGGNEPSKIKTISCTKFNNGSIAIFDKKSKFWIFNSLELTWSLSNASNAPKHKLAYCTIIPPDETILCIRRNVDKNNTFKSVLMNKNTTGPTPPNRIFFSTVLTSNKHIIIFGGVNEDCEVFRDLWILDIETYQWSTRNISNPNNLTLCGHTVTLVDNYMIVAFGVYDREFNESSSIYMLDVSQKDFYKWVTEFIPTLPLNNLTFTGDSESTDASVCSGENNNDLFIFGSLSDSETFANKYNISNQHWTNITSGIRDGDFKQISDHLDIQFIKINMEFNHMSFHIVQYLCLMKIFLYIDGAHFIDKGNIEIMPLNSVFTCEKYYSTSSIYMLDVSKRDSYKWFTEFIPTLSLNNLTFTGDTESTDASMCSSGNNNNFFIFGSLSDSETFANKYNISNQHWTKKNYFMR
ncbi:26935_t:CDS:10, partial [Gigaspora margarita]